jgi:hypothetical protein
VTILEAWIWCTCDRSTRLKLLASIRVDDVADDDFVQQRARNMGADILEKTLSRSQFLEKRKDVN